MTRSAHARLRLVHLLSLTIFLVACAEGYGQQCPDDPDKNAPGACGCGVADTDQDNDGTPNCVDECPDDPDKIEAGVCGCGVPDSDQDDDGTPSCLDECPDDPDKVAAGECDCGVPDTDQDHDGTPNCLDECPDDPDKIAAGECDCGVPDTDQDHDGTPNCLDECIDDPDKTTAGECGCHVPEGTCVTTPYIEMSEATYDVDEAIVVNFYNLPGNPTDWVGTFSTGSSDTVPLDLVCAAGAEDGVMIFANSAAGDYQARLFFNDSYDLEYEVSFTVVNPDQCPDDADKTEPGECGCGMAEGTCAGIPYIKMSKASYDVDEPIVVYYYNLPGNLFDWVGTFSAGSAHTADLDYFYLWGNPTGVMQFPGRAAGDYQARLFFDDTYNLEQQVSFTVQEIAQDHCLADPDKNQPGECGCGTPEGSCVSTPYIEMSKTSYAVNEPIIVYFHNLPGNPYDWVGTFAPGGDNTAFIDFLDGWSASDGVMYFAGRAAGTYQARLFFDDTYDLEYQVLFTVL